MNRDLLEARLRAAIASHDLLQHPFYRAWSMGQLTLGDLRAYAAQYRHQVDQLPSLLARARQESGDAETVLALSRNLAEELGERAPEGVAGAEAAVAHRALWLDFASGIGADRARVASELPDAETRASAEQLAALVGAGEAEALGALWAYEAQTARVSTSKREGLCAFYGVTDPQTTAFFTAHEGLDLHHADDLLSALARACARGGEAALERACSAAGAAAQAQWLFLDGVQARRAVTA
jgi:pyrroloquinoline-quinone synthase